MKYTLGLIILFCLHPSCGKKVDPQKSLLTEPLSVEDSQEVIDKWLNLWATYDLDLLKDIFYPSESNTYFSSEKKGLIIGYDQLRPHHEGFGFVEGGKVTSNSLWLEDVKITPFEHSSIVAGIWFFGDKSMPKDSIQNGPVTFVITRDDFGDPKILHTHFANY